MTSIDVVVVSFNSRKHLRSCVEPFLPFDDVQVTVVDNGSNDDSVSAVADLPITLVPLESNHGFAYGCNVGWRAGEAPFVLFLNPDARIEIDAVRCLARQLVENPKAGAVGPKLLDMHERLAFSQRRFPRVLSTYAQAFFVHRLLRGRQWTGEVVCEPRKYEVAQSPEWLSGACLLVRRSLLEALNGLDSDFFLYGEDVDLCKRIRQAGFEVLYEPGAVARHEGGASSPRALLLPVLAESRIRYATKHRGRGAQVLERLGIAVGALTHLVAGQGGVERRLGHARSLRVAFRRLPRERSRGTG